MIPMEETAEVYLPNVWRCFLAPYLFPADDKGASLTKYTWVLSGTGPKETQGTSTIRFMGATRVPHSLFPEIS